MKVLVCGGRDYRDKQAIKKHLDRLLAAHGSKLSIIHGAARGADTLAGEWATENNVPQQSFPISPADWLKLGRSAGPIRNRRMLIEGKPDFVIAFPGGRGTKDMADQATRAGIPTFVYHAT